MSLLTDDELWALVPNADNLESARAIEAAILAKLGAMALPEPLSMGSSVAGVFLDVYLPVHLHQAYAQGAAAQLAERPSAWSFKQNRVHNCLQFFCPPDDAYDEGTLIELYTRREA
jgi:hypothetical protein